MVAWFLVAITEGVFPSNDMVELETLVFLGQLLDKYGCNAAIQSFKLYLWKLLDKEDDTVECFVIAAALDDVELCVKCFSMPEERWCLLDDNMELRDDVECSADLGAHGQPRFHPQTLPLKWWRLIPSDYLWALSRAWAHTDGEMEDMGHYFKEFLEVARRESRLRPG